MKIKNEVVMKNYSNVLQKTVKVQCPQYNREIDVFIRYITCDNKLILCDFNGCDFGYNGSDVCKQCGKSCIETFKNSFAKS